MADLQTDVRYIRGIGEKKALSLNRLGVFSLFDLVSFFPRRYEDRTVFRKIEDCAEGENVCIRALVAETPSLRRIRKGMELVKFRVVDETGSVDITYFNQSYRRDQFRRGESYCFYGRIELRGRLRMMSNPECEREGDEHGVTGGIVPIYPLTAGLNQRTMRQSIAAGLAACAEKLPELLPEELRERNGLAQARYAYEKVHFPGNMRELELARRRLVFEEFFMFACALGRMRGERVRQQGCPVSAEGLTEFFASLPFEPTRAQRRAIDEALRDMNSTQVMNRLVQGDVGSGKTLVAAALAYCTVRSGKKAAFMAPTEILIEQHTETLRSFLSPFGIRVEKLSGSMRVKEKNAVKKALAAGEIDVIVGTHALFSESVEYRDLALVITDEQHRFGVKQRSALIGKGEVPHVLVMSATPIPRTLSLMLYGDLDVSVLDELPPGRQKVDTFTVDESYRVRLNGFIEKLVGEGRQVFVVCPKVEEDEEENALKLKSAEEHAKALAELFPALRVGCVHGRMKAKDKDAAMAAFVRHETDILVSTTVIEVGVDVPNAALMIVENAERFGLSQLHQLRGRVGRGKHKSWCILVSDHPGEESRARLKIMSETNDGFRIAEADLRLRGPGDFFGERQAGLPGMHVADLGADIDVLQRAQEEAKRLLQEDPELTQHRELKARVDGLFAANADSFN